MFEPVGWGIRGAAASTAASEWLAAAAYTWLLAAGPTREQLGLWPPPPPLQLAELRQRCLPFLQVCKCISRVHWRSGVAWPLCCNVQTRWQLVPR